jgi:hypothetical protein
MATIPRRRHGRRRPTPRLSASNSQMKGAKWCLGLCEYEGMDLTGVGVVVEPVHGVRRIRGGDERCRAISASMKLLAANRTLEHDPLVPANTEHNLEDTVVTELQSPLRWHLPCLFWRGCPWIEDGGARVLALVGWGGKGQGRPILIRMGHARGWQGPSLLWMKKGFWRGGPTG